MTNDEDIIYNEIVAFNKVPKMLKIELFRS